MFFGKSKDGAAKGGGPSQQSPVPAAANDVMGRSCRGQLNDAAAMGRHKTSTDVLLEDLHVVKENHRLHPQSFTWSSQHLTGDDPKSFTSEVGGTDVFPKLLVQKGWEYSSEWRVDLDYIKSFIPNASAEYYRRDSDDGFDDVNTDQEGAGWVYALSFDELQMGKVVPPTKGALVRQRRHVRMLINIQSSYLYASMPNEIEPEFGQFDIEIEDDGEPCDYTDDASTVLTGSDHTPTHYDPGPMKTPVIQTANSSSNNNNKQSPKLHKAYSRSSILSNISTVFGRASAIATSSSSSGGETMDPLWRVISPELLELGKKIRTLEAEVRKYSEQQQRSWKADEKPRLEEDIASLEKQCSSVVSRIEKEAGLGIDHVQGLEDALRDLTDQLDLKKRSLYFPNSTYTFGSSGVYFGLDAFWLQFASGHFILNLTPDSVLHTSPHMSLLLAGTSKNPSSGVTIKCKLEGFKLHGDRGSKVPKLAFENLKLHVGLTLAMKITYDMEKQSWSLPANRFNLKIISFKGPYGLNRSIVGMVLSFLTPIIRAKLIQLIPYELGVFVQSFPSPFSVKGEFDMHGIDMNSLHVDLFRNDVFLELCEYSRPQLEMFLAMQRAMDRPTMLRSISDIIAYQRSHKVHREKWPLMLWLWREASAVYSDAVVASKMQQGTASSNPEDHRVSFDTIVRACDDIKCKRTAANCTLQYVDGQVSVNMFLQFFFQVQYRLASEQLLKASGIAKVRLQAFMDIVQKQYDVSVAVLSLLCQNVDFAHLTVLGELHSGPQGEALFKVRDLLAQAPMKVDLCIHTDKNLGCLPLVPFMLSFQPQSNGDVCIELYHFNQELVNPGAKSGDNTVAKYSSHYNKVLNKVTHNRKMGLSRGRAMPKEELGSRGEGETGRTAQHHLSKSSSAGSQGAGRSVLDDSQWVGSSSSSFPTAHLTVRQYDLESSLAWTLQDYPKNEESDTILVVVATNPHLSVIVDKPVKLLAGTELFTFILGPKVTEWKPLGKATLLDPSNDFKLQEPSPQPFASRGRRRPHSVLRTTPLEEVLRAPEVVQAATVLTGCPIKLQTAPGIKLLFQVAKSFVNVNTSGFFRFLLAHFADVTLLKEYLEIFLGGLFSEEQLRVTQKIIEKTAKYLMLPGIDLDLNINFRLVTLHNEFMVRIETPQSMDQVEHDQLHSDRYTRGDYSQSVDSQLSAVNLRVELSLVGLMEDVAEFIQFAARLFEITTPIPTAGGGDNSSGSDTIDLSMKH